MNPANTCLPVTIASGESARAALQCEISKALILMEIGLANPKPYSGPLLEAWTIVLHTAGIEPEEVSPVTAMLMKSENFFPTPAVFIRYARPVVELDDEVELAWQRVKQAIFDFGRNASLTAADLAADGAALWAVSRLGWAELCEELTVDTENLKRASFARTYKMARNQGLSLNYLAGAFEKDNDLKNRDLAPELCGRPDWKNLPNSSGKAAEQEEGLVPIDFAKLANQFAFIRNRRQPPACP